MNRENVDYYDGQSIILHVSKDKVHKTPRGDYIVDTGLTPKELLIMMSGAICNPGHAVILNREEEE